MLRRVPLVLVLLLVVAAPAGAAGPVRPLPDDPPPLPLPSLSGVPPLPLEPVAPLACEHDEAVVDPPPVGTTLCPGVRPGALLRLDGGGCTMNYLILGRDPVTHATSRYIGTAGHCVLGSDGERVWAPGTGPSARDANDADIGRVVYAVRGGGRDWALVRLDDRVAASAQMCHFGGPTGVNADRTSAWTTVRYYGHGLLVGGATPARSGLAPGTPDPDEAFAYGLTSFGDSGAPVNTADGRALGIAVSVGGNVDGLTGSGVIGITRLAPQLQRAAEVLRLELSLATAPTLDLDHVVGAPPLTPAALPL